jgi:hypothetical protein
MDGISKYTPKSQPQNKSRQEEPSNKATAKRQKGRIHSRLDSGVDITNVRKRVFKEKADNFVGLLAKPDADARKLANKFDKLCNQVDTGAVDSNYFVDQLTLSVRGLPSGEDRNTAEVNLGWVASHDMTPSSAKLLTMLRSKVDQVLK